ncbi:MarR family winged helix-turn-helix transcriptional regulator [Staphylococcus carnosus]|uniref:MarR family winged helix-turn-helix transcriptional regulator n=1 Tax=Staphylococcus carnosus TaxID=1281 RepID=UPI001EEE0A53|nr:MarR family transcriptional regulator [Staphylococcus carnosus]
MAPLATTIQYLIRMISNEMKIKADRLLEPYGITQEQAQILRFIFEHESKAITQNDLIETFNLKGATVSSTLTSLKKKKLIDHFFDEDDTRKKRVGLSRTAYKEVRDIIEVLNRVETVIFEGIPDADRDALKSILITMHDNLQELDEM